MKTQKKAIKRTHSKRKIAVAIIITAMAIIILISALRQQTETPINPTKKDPNEYFQFLNAKALATNVSQSTIKISILSFNLKPIRGDAHHVVIKPEGMVNLEEYPYYLEIKNGTEEPVIIQFPYPILVSKHGDAYPVTLRIWSDEAEGEVTLRLKDEDIETW